MTTSFEKWVEGRSVPNLGTNTGAVALAFQAWQHFKEAFAPEFVTQAINSVEGPVQHCLDPFGGSGTTALACQFLGVEPTTIEVNPYLADLIEAKLCDYDISSLAKDVGEVIEGATQLEVDPDSILTNGPSTMVEPGHKNNWIFDRVVAERILSLRQCIDRVADERNRRLMRVILGGQLIDFSNVRISGKGRRYRNGWRERKIAPETVIECFVANLSTAVHDITLHRNRPTKSYEVRRGDARALVQEIEPVDVIVFSPPYPNSFDYTDVYNVELWMLGYLSNGTDNAQLRHATFTSHVQLKRDYETAPTESQLLSSVLEKLDKKRNALWHRDIPAMIGGYFADFAKLMSDPCLSG